MALNVAEKRILVGISCVLLAAATISSLFVVDESEYAVVLRFGRVISVIEEPGLKVKLPAPIDQIRRFDKRVLYQQIPQTEFLSADKKNVLVSSFLTWRIQSPSVFLQALSNRDSAESRLSTLVKSSLGAALGNRPFSDYIPEEPDESSPAESGENLLRLEGVVFEGISNVATADYGIEIVIVRHQPLQFSAAESPRGVRPNARGTRTNSQRLSFGRGCRGHEDPSQCRTRAPRDPRKGGVGG